MATPALGFDNFFTTTLTSGITAADTTIPLNALPTATEGFLVIEPDSTTNREIIYYTSKGGSSVTCPSAALGRGIGGTTASSHSSGVTVKCNTVAEMFEALQSTEGMGTNYTQAWVPGSGTWTYISATSFSVPSADAGAMSVGTKIKMTNSGTKYFYVTGVSGTTITVTGGSDYSVANAAITSPYFSNATTPQGFPVSFNYTPTWAGVTAAFTSVNRFTINGNLCTVTIARSTNQTSNATTLTATLPVTAKTVASMVWKGVASRVADNSVAVTTPGLVEVSSAATTMSIYKDMNGGAWTAANTKGADVQVIYEI